MDYKWTPEEKKVVDGLQFELEYAKRNNLASARVPRGMLEKGLNMLESQQERIAIMSEDGWVSVDDHLPDKGKPCFITYYYQHPYAGEGYAVYQGFVGLSEDGEWVDTDGDEISPYLGDVTHWQYANIPEPPKEGETQ